MDIVHSCALSNSFMEKRLDKREKTKILKIKVKGSLRVFTMNMITMGILFGSQHKTAFLQC